MSQRKIKTTDGYIVLFSDGSYITITCVTLEAKPC